MVVQTVTIGQAAVAELAECVVLIAQGRPALMLTDKAILQVVFVGQRPGTVVDSIGFLQTVCVFNFLKNG